MEHRPYPRIYTSTVEKAGGGHWIATEKVHGANLVVATDGRDVRIGKRKAWLGEDEPFFGWQLLRPSLSAAALSVWRSLGGKGSLRLHGELYGGAYPHPKVPPILGNSAVQTGVWYAPDIRFSLFDIQVDSEDGPQFLAHRVLEKLGVECGIETVPVLARGSRTELNFLSARFITRVPRLHDLPPLAENYAEGFVLKPDVALPVATRPAIKCKIPEFEDARFDDGAAWDPQVYLSAEALLERAKSVMNTARLASARSKVGENRLAVCDEAVLDALVDLEEAFPGAMAALDEQGLEAIRGELGRRCLDLFDTGIS